MTYLIVPIAAPDLERAGQQVKAALAAGAEMLELRTDYIENLSVDLVKDLIAQTRAAMRRPIPIIVTCRDKRQGGTLDYPQKLRIDALTTAIKAGVEFVDVEFDNFLSTENQERIRVALSQSAKGRLILSAHNFKTKFENIKKLYRGILTAYPVAIPKLVYTANHINDCFEAFDILHQTSDDCIVWCMGQAGLISRIIAKKLSSFVAFACIDEQSATAPGQLTIEQFKDLYRFEDINSNTELFGVIADPVDHSLSPEIHNACFADKGMNKLYLPLLVQGGQDKFNKFLDNIILRKWLHFKGFSVTIPHKHNALNYAGTTRAKYWAGSYSLSIRGFIEPLAEKIGAVNTLVVGAENKVAGYNTDYAAALDSITSVRRGGKIRKASLKSLPVAIVGAGGVARAIVAGLSDADAKIKIYNRTLERAERLAAEFGCEFAGLDDLQDLDAKLLINCTSIGMHPNIDATPVPKEYLKKGMVIFDTVYNPAQTLLLKQAKRKKLKTIDGLSMFINQALAQFKLFTGQNANPVLMRKTICTYLPR